MSAPRVQVRCPSCRTEYVFPEHLMGPEGARVVCPSCGARFRVARLPLADEIPVPSGRGTTGPGLVERSWVPASAPIVSSAPAAPEPMVASAPDEDEPSELRSAAEQSLGPLRLERDRVRRAAEAGRLFAEFGLELLDAFDRFSSSSACRAHGPRVRRQSFARAVRDHLGVTLPAAAGDAP